MADPAACIDVGSQLRGLGTRLSKFGTVITPPASCGIWPPPPASQTAASIPIGIPRPRAGRDPHGIVGGRLVAESQWAPAVVDDRPIQSIIGKTSRMDDRAEVRIRR